MRDPVAGPQLRQRRVIAARNLGDLHVANKGTVGARAGELDAATPRTAPLAEHHDRPLGEQIGLRGGLDIVGIEVLKVHAHIREHGALDVLTKALRFGSGLFRLRHDERLAATSARHAFDQVAIDAAADAKRKHVGVAQVLLDQLERAALLRDVSVGHEHHAARAAGRARQRQHALQRGFELGAAAAVLIIDERQRSLEIGLRSGQRTLREQPAWPENSNTLKLSSARKPATSSAISSFAVSSGKPCMEPETSRTNTYSRGGRTAGMHPRGRLQHEQEVFLLAPSNSNRPLSGCAPVSR